MRLMKTTTTIPLSMGTFHTIEATSGVSQDLFWKYLEVGNLLSYKWFILFFKLQEQPTGNCNFLLHYLKGNDNIWNSSLIQE